MHSPTAVGSGDLWQALETILTQYGEPYFIRRDHTVGGYPVAALAEMTVREPKKIFGLSTPGLKMGESVAGEFLIFLVEDVLTVEAVERMGALAKAAKSDLVLPGESRTFTFFSVAALVNSAEPAAAKRLKKFREKGGPAVGWGMTRLAAVAPAAGRMWCNIDGKDLGKLLLTKLASPR